MKDIVTLCGGVVGITLICVTVRRVSPDWAMPVGVCLGLFIMRYALSYIYPVVLYVRELFEGSEYGEYLTVSLKTLGIAVAVHITCETCRDLGESSAAAKVELCGKAAMLVCAIPVVKRIFSYINSFLQ